MTRKYTKRQVVVSPAEEQAQKLAAQLYTIPKAVEPVKEKRAAGIKLTRLESVKMYGWLQKTRDRVKEERMSVGVAAALASREMGLAISDYSMKMAGKDLGIEFESGYHNRQVLAQLDREALLVLTGAVTDLYIEMGIKMPVKLEGLKDRLTTEMRNEAVRKELGQ